MTDSEKLDLIISKLAETDKKLDRLDKLENDITEIKLTLENEIRTGIMRVAEGHLDLSRNLKKAIEIDDEKEMMAIRISMLETEVRRIKEQVKQLAG